MLYFSSFLVEAPLSALLPESLPQPATRAVVITAANPITSHFFSLLVFMMLPPQNLLSMISGFIRKVVAHGLDDLDEDNQYHHRKQHQRRVHPFIPVGQGQVPTPPAPMAPAMAVAPISRWCRW